MKPEEVLNASFDDLVFERKNKAYGAYFLRQIYQRHITTALIISLIIFLIGFSTPTILSLFAPKEIAVAKPKITTTTLAPPPPIEPNTPPPPPPPKVPPPPPQVKLTPPVIKADEEVKQEDVPPPVQEVQKAEPAATNFDANAKVDFSDAPAVVEEKKPQIFTFVQQMPAYPGGDKELMKYLSNNIKYPTAARENQVEGTVLLEFVVNEDGAITDVKALREVSGGCTEEAVRVVKNMPKWNAGVQNGNKVKVLFHLPINFKLNAE